MQYYTSSTIEFFNILTNCPFYREYSSFDSAKFIDLRFGDFKEDIFVQINCCKK